MKERVVVFGQWSGRIDPVPERGSELYARALGISTGEGEIDEGTWVTREMLPPVEGQYNYNHKTGIGIMEYEQEKEAS